MSSGELRGASLDRLGTSASELGLSKADALGGYLAIHFKTGFRLMYAAIEIAADHFRKSYLQDIAKAVNDYDRRILLDPKFADAFGDASAECFAQGANGLVQDAELAYRGWAFDVTKIERPMHLWQGTDDKLVAPFINLTVAERMPGAVWHPVEGAGHSIVTSGPSTALATLAPLGMTVIVLGGKLARCDP